MTVYKRPEPKLTRIVPATVRTRRFWQTLAFKRGLTGWLFAMPILLYFAVFVFGPIIASMTLVFFEWDGFGALSTARFVGLGNLKELAGDPRFLGAYRNTLIYAAVVVSSNVVIGLALALAVNKVVRGAGFVRAVYFFPVVLPLTAMSLLWALLYQPAYGLFNQLLSMVGLPRMLWLYSTKTALLSICLMIIWKEVGWYMVIFLAGIKAIPEEYYEAARIDGAGGWQQFRNISLPLLRPTLLFVIVVSAINSLQVFSPIYIMTKGDPVNATNTVVYWMYRTAFYHLRFGYGTSMAASLFIAIFIFTLFQFRIFREGGVRSY